MKGDFLAGLVSEKHDLSRDTTQMFMRGMMPGEYSHGQFTMIAISRSGGLMVAMVVSFVFVASPYPTELGTSNLRPCPRFYYNNVYRRALARRMRDHAIPEDAPRMHR